MLCDDEPNDECNDGGPGIELQFLLSSAGSDTGKLHNIDLGEERHR